VVTVEVISVDVVGGAQAGQGGDAHAGGDQGLHDDHVVAE
jgi:hypothetical protein